MQDIKKILKQAQSALEALQSGKNYPSVYVVSRLNSALDKHPHNQLIGNMRDVFTKIASKNEFISQAQIAETYNNFYGLSGNSVDFRAELGDLLPSSLNVENTVKVDASNLRTNEGTSVEPLFGASDASRAFEKLFPVKEIAASKFSDGIFKKAEKFAQAQLESIGCKPDAISIIEANEHFALCLASYGTPDMVQIGVKVPVQISENVVKFPEHLIHGNELLPLTKENIYVQIADEMNVRKANLKNKFALDRSETVVTIDPVVVPASLQQFTDIENELVAAGAHFTPTDVRYASNIVSTELMACGVKSPQLKVASSTKNVLTFSASIPTASGRKDVTVPVEFHNGKPTLPSKFVYASDAYDFDTASVSRFLNENLNTETASFSRDHDNMENMSFHELSDLVTAGALKNDYKLSEDALDAIGSRFPDQFKFALDTFSKLLKNASATSIREKLIKEAIKRGELISVPTSIEPYSPKFALPVSKLDFDESGRLIPSHRKKASEVEAAIIATNASRIIMN